MLPTSSSKKEAPPNLKSSLNLYLNLLEYYIFTYRNTLAFDAIHDPKWGSQIRVPSGAQFSQYFAKLTFGN